MSFKINCPNCNTPCDTNMKMIGLLNVVTNGYLDVDNLFCSVLIEIEILNWK